MTLPRLDRGRWGKVTYREVNTVFAAVDRLNRVWPSEPGPERVPQHTLVARILGLAAGFTQGETQSGAVVAGGTLVRSYLYDFQEVTFSIGDAGGGSTSPASKLNSAGIRGETTTQTYSGPRTTIALAVDFALTQRFAAGDLVTITSICNRTSGVEADGVLVTYYAITSEPKTTTFLARLTASHATYEGVYEWVALNRDITAGGAGRLATNLYESNQIRDADTPTTLLYEGSGNWGHGQSLSGSGGLGTMTKNALPVGAAGTGTIVIMHEGPTDHFYFYSVAPVTPACPA